MNHLVILTILFLALLTNLTQCQANFMEQFQNAFNSAETKVEKFVNDGSQVVNFVNKTNNAAKSFYSGWFL